MLEHLRGFVDSDDGMAEPDQLVRDAADTATKLQNLGTGLDHAVDELCFASRRQSQVQLYGTAIRRDRHGTLPPSRVTLQAARVRGSTQLAVRLLDGSYPAERPVGLDRDLVAAPAKVVDDGAREPGLDGERPRHEAARVEGRDQVLGVKLGRVDRLLQVQPTVHVVQENVEGPLLLLV